MFIAILQTINQLAKIIKKLCIRKIFIALCYSIQSLSPVGVKKAPAKLSIAKRRTKYNSRGCQPTEYDNLSPIPIPIGDTVQ